LPPALRAQCEAVTVTGSSRKYFAAFSMMRGRSIATMSNAGLSEVARAVS